MNSKLVKSLYEAMQEQGFDFLEIKTANGRLKLRVRQTTLKAVEGSA